MKMENARWQKGTVTEMLNNYLTILEESLKKKAGILDRIQELNQAQMELFKTEKPDLEKYDGYVEEKSDCIAKIEKLDEGFETVYEKVKKELMTNQNLHAEQIKRLQALISLVTEKSVSIQAQENRNKDMVTAYFKKEREGIREGRKASKAAYGYYQSLSKAGRENSSIMDFKK